MSESRRAENDARAASRRPVIEEKLAAIRTTRSVQEIEADQRSWVAIEKARQRVARAESYLSGLTEGDPPTGDRSEIVRRLEEARERCLLAHSANAEIRQRLAAEADLSTAQQRIAARKEWLERLLRIQREMLDSVLPRLLRPLREILGRPVDVRLEDERHREVCQFVVGSATASTLSDGEQWLFVAGLFGALYSITPREKARWRLLTMDRAESVSLAERNRFLARSREYLDEGIFDQIVVCGCQDTRPSGRFIAL